MRSAGRLWVTVVAAGCASRVTGPERGDAEAPPAPDHADAVAPQDFPPPPPPPPGSCVHCPPLPSGCRNIYEGTISCNPPPVCTVTCTRHVALRCRLGGTDSLSFHLRTCERDDECAPAEHRTDCCGNPTVHGIRRDALADFEREEAACRMRARDCGCRPSAPVAEDGRSGDIVVGCVEGLCQTFVR